jgi:hypothetical protein
LPAARWFASHADQGDRFRMRLPWILVATLLIATACHQGRLQSNGLPDGGTSGSTGSALDAGTDGGRPPHVTLDGGQLLIDGKPTFLYGGEVHYFRVRSDDLDAGASEAMWGETLDLMRDAGMNLVSTYVPWDFHNPAEGQWDFSGARDLGKFLQMACDRGLHLIVKPGPLITAEWPRGFGTYGAIPEWWKDAHPETLIHKANGSVWTYSFNGDMSQKQPTYLHPTYLAAVQDWFDHVLPIVRPFAGGCLIGLQVDNETNLYWGNHCGDVDYSDTAIANYRQFLGRRYGTIDALNRQYGTAYSSFDAVAPPSGKPGSRAENVQARDWYEAGQDDVHRYLKQIRRMLEGAGFHEPEVLFFTNDSPFAVTAGPVLLQNALLHDFTIKDDIGIPSLDLYPKQLPAETSLQDQPFQADFFTRLYDGHRSADGVTRHFAYAAELQGGFFSYPVIGAPEVRAQATDQLLARTIGHGLKGGAFYVIRGGINADGSDYDYLAAISRSGTTTDRFAVIARWGAFLSEHGAFLQRATEVNSRVAVLVDHRYSVPQAGVLDNLQLLHANENPALLGWLINAGFDPEVIDATEVTASDLSRFKVVFFQNPDFVGGDTAALLNRYVRDGGVLINLLWPGRFDLAWQPSTALGPLFPAMDQGYYAWPSLGRSGDFNASFGTFNSTLKSYWYESFWSDPSGTLTPIAHERTQPSGADGKLVSYLVQDGLGTRVFMGTNVYSWFNRGGYYTMDTARIADTMQLARYLVSLGGEAPILTTDQPRQLSWARVVDDRVYVFVINDGGAPVSIHVTLRDPARLGLDPARAYTARDALHGTSLGSFPAGALAARGLDIPVQGEATAVVVLEPQ